MVAVWNLKTQNLDVVWDHYARAIRKILKWDEDTLVVCNNNGYVDRIDIGTLEASEKYPYGRFPFLKSHERRGFYKYPRPYRKYLSDYITVCDTVKIDDDDDFFIIGCSNPSKLILASCKSNTDKQTITSKNDPPFPFHCSYNSKMTACKTIPCSFFLACGSGDSYFVKHIQVNWRFLQNDFKSVKNFSLLSQFNRHGNNFIFDLKTYLKYGTKNEILVYFTSTLPSDISGGLCNRIFFYNIDKPDTVIQEIVINDVLFRSVNVFQDTYAVFGDTEGYVHFLDLTEKHLYFSKSHRIHQNEENKKFTSSVNVIKLIHVEKYEEEKKVTCVFATGGNDQKIRFSKVTGLNKMKPLINATGSWVNYLVERNIGRKDLKDRLDLLYREMMIIESSSGNNNNNNILVGSVFKIVLLNCEFYGFRSLVWKKNTVNTKKKNIYMY